MESGSFAPILTPHGRLTLAPEADAPYLDSAVAERLSRAFERGSGHGLLQLGAAEAGTTLPPALSYWREFAAGYVTALCTHSDAESEQPGVRVPIPEDADLDGLVLSAPPMTGAEYLSAP